MAIARYSEFCPSLNISVVFIVVMCQFLIRTDSFLSIVARLAPNSGLLGHSQEDAALVDQWIHLVETEVAIATDNIRFLLDGRISPYSKSVIQFLYDPFHS